MQQCQQSQVGRAVRINEQILPHHVVTALPLLLGAVVPGGRRDEALKLEGLTTVYVEDGAQQLRALLDEDELRVEEEVL